MTKLFLSLLISNTVHSQMTSASGTLYRTRTHGFIVFGKDAGVSLATAHLPFGESGLPVFSTTLFESIWNRLRTRSTACFPISSGDDGLAVCCAYAIETRQASDIATPAKDCKDLRKFMLVEAPEYRMVNKKSRQLYQPELRPQPQTQTRAPRRAPLAHLLNTWNRTRRKAVTIEPRMIKGADATTFRLDEKQSTRRRRTSLAILIPGR